MNLHQWLLALLLLVGLGMAPFAKAAEEPAVNFKREPHYNELPTTELLKKRVHVEFVGSPKATKLLQEKLSAQGYQIVQEAENADAKIRFDGVFMVAGRGKETVKGKLGDLLESSMRLKAPSNPDYGHQNVDIAQVAAGRLFTGSFSPTDLITYLGQKSGIAGRFNELITGDPRGWCWHESCDKVWSHVVMQVRGDAGHWWVQVSAQEKSIVLDQAIAEAIDATMRPFVDVTRTGSATE